jgi:hypothetical protein
MPDYPTIKGKRLKADDGGHSDKLTGKRAVEFTLSDVQIFALAEIARLESASAVRVRVPAVDGAAPRKATGVEVECWAPGSGWTEPYAVRPSTGAFASESCDWWREPPREGDDEVAAATQGVVRQERSAGTGELREDAPAA